VFRRAASWSVTLPVGYRSWTFAHPRGSRPRSGPRCRSDLRRPALRRVPPPVGFFAPPALPVRGIHFPARRVPPAASRRLAPPVGDRSCRRGSHRDGSTVPRRGVPPPLRSASVVSHDHGGLFLPGPCGVFRPLTPMRFRAPSPRFDARPRRPEGLRVQARGAGFRYEELLVGSVRAADKAEASPPSANGTAASAAHATAPASRSPHAFAWPTIGPPSGCPDVRLPASRVRDAPPGLPRSIRPVRAAVTASCHDLFGPAPLQGLPSSHCPGLPPAFYRGRRPVPPGTNRYSTRERVLPSIRLRSRPKRLSAS